MFLVDHGITMSTSPSLSNLLKMPSGKMRLVSSQDRQPLSGMMAKVAPGEPGKMIEIPPGESFVLADLAGAGQIVRIWMTTMNLPGEGHNFNHYGVLRFFWDGEQTPSVEVPFGDFFGVPWGKYTHYTAEPLSCTSGGYNCNFIMPFARGCRIEAVNQSSEPWPALFFQIQYLEMAEQPSLLRFHAQWRRQNPTKQHVPYRILEAQGMGNFAGVHLFMQNAEWWLDPRRMARRAKETGTPFGAFFPEMVGMGMLEGWERIYVDDEPVPSMTGTGTEDYFNSGFYFSNGTFSAPYWGCTVRDYLTSRCAAYRFHIPDPIPFQHSLVVDMDHGYTNQVAGDYTSVAYWYQSEPHADFSPLPPVEERLPEPVGRNAYQFALFSSPVWLPAAVLGLKLLNRILAKKN
jgi:hypothetical protein